MLVICIDGREVKGNGLQNRTIVGSNPTQCSKLRNTTDSVVKRKYVHVALVGRKVQTVNLVSVSSNVGSNPTVCAN